MCSSNLEILNSKNSSYSQLGRGRVLVILPIVLIQLFPNWTARSYITNFCPLWHVQMSGGLESQIHHLILQNMFTFAFTRAWPRNIRNFCCWPQLFNRFPLIECGIEVEPSVFIIKQNKGNGLEIVDNVHTVVFAFAASSWDSVHRLTFFFSFCIVFSLSSFFNSAYCKIYY